MHLPTFEQMQIFATIAQLQSLSRTATQLQLPTTSVSRKLAELEASLGVKLVHRTTRKLSLSTAGLNYLELFRPLLEEMHQLENHLQRSQQEPQGLIRLTAPVSYAISRLRPQLEAFQQRYSQVDLQVFLKSEYVDLVAEGLDLAIRVAPLRDSNLVCRPFDKVRYVCVATAEYLRTSPTISEPQDLHQHRIIGLAPQPGLVEWSFDHPAGHFQIQLSAKLVVNDPVYALHTCLAGGGVAYLPDFLVNDHLQSGALQSVLTPWQPRARDIYVVFHHRKLNSPAIGALLDFLQQGVNP